MDSSLDVFHVMKGGILRLRQKCCSLNIPFETPWNGVCSLDDSSWLTSLWKWMTKHELTMSVPFQPPTPLFQGDICKMDHIVDFKLSQLSEPDKRLIIQISRGTNIQATEPVANFVRSVELLQHHFC